MAHREPVLGYQDLNVLRQTQKAQEIGYRRPIFASALTELLMAQVVLPREAIQGLRDFDGIQVFTLNVLDQGDLEEAFAGEFLHNGRHFSQFRQTGRTPPAFTGNQLVSVGGTLQDQGLNDAVGAY